MRRGNMNSSNISGVILGIKGNTLFSLFICFSAFCLCFCKLPPPENASSNQVRPKALALSPALTEMLFFLAEDSQVVAVSPFCTYPPELVKNKPKLETYPLDFEQLLALKPDLVFTEEGISSPQDIRKMESLGIKVHSFSYSNCADILLAMDSVAKWMGSKSERKMAIDSIRLALSRLETEQQEIRQDSRPSVLAITWIDPIFAYGHETWMSDKIRLAGGKNVLQEKLDKPYPTLQRETVLKLQPEVMFGGSFEKMDTSFFRLYPELRSIPAYKSRRIYELNDDLATRPGPRFVQGILEIQSHLSRKSKLLPQQIASKKTP